ncbi:hypothetical protein G7074_08410 [Pedobacter sp. HDW13]|uniref:hypothetical protein n=1 Tax=Pedobacter sp. HDW13 TaxID=2714940 RepID=UPI00140AE769|nr:hypothetical protein [Pedobacter sp. HDW13]QIL39296.1 hypothetical protein G7074_08410 [Pedobacter sp. HDW13]
MKAPDYYQPIMPYLCIKDASQFIDFIKTVFDAEIKLIVPREDGSTMHAEATIDKGTIMFTQANEMYSPYGSALFIFRPGQWHFTIRLWQTEQPRYKSLMKGIMA